MTHIIQNVMSFVCGNPMLFELKLYIKHKKTVENNQRYSI